MTATERKQNTEKLLKALGVPIPAELPPIEEENNVRPKTPQQIAERILILTYLNCAATDADLAEPIVKFLKQEGLWEKASAMEKALLTKAQLTDEEVTIIQWRGESIWMLLWIINKVDIMDLPATEVDPRDIFDKLPGFMTSTGDFIRSATIRPLSELLDQSDLIFRLTWAMRKEEDSLDSEMGLNQSIAYERFYAINWATSVHQWDETNES